MRETWSGILVAAESALLVCLLLLGAWLFHGWTSPAGQPGTLGATLISEQMPSYGTSQLTLAVLVIAGVYGLLQFLRRSRLAFWLVAVLTLLPHTPGIWDHNKLEWQRFLGIDVSFGGGHSLVLTVGLFLACLSGLVILHRIIALRRLGHLLTSQRVDGQERDGILINEGKALGGMVAVGLALALLLVTAGTAIGRSEWLSATVPWTVITIGGGASLLLLGFVALFLRGLGTSGGTGLPGDE